MSNELDSILKSPCREVKPLEPFPFKSNRISRGVRFQHFLILFPFYPEYKKLHHHLYTFNLYTRKWNSVPLINSPEILENTDNYKVASNERNGFILFGCYKAFESNTTGNLFFQSQTMTLKKTLGRISARIDQGELILEWKECEGADQLPYREKFSISFWRYYKEYMTFFGGCDENGTVTKDLFLFNFNNKSASKLELVSTWGKEDLPCSRMNHGSTNGSVLLLFGGEDKDSNMINDVWKMSSLASGGGKAKCTRYTKNPTKRCPKLGTPCLWYNDSLLFIAKSSLQTLPPFKSYLCKETYQKHDRSEVQSQKEPLPFDGVPHTMEIFEKRLILGFESSIYSIDFEGTETETKPELAPGFESYFEDSPDMMVTHKVRPRDFKGHMRQYFEERPYPDVKFKVQGEVISAHRGILSVRCPFFGELFGAESIDLCESFIKVNFSKGKRDEPVEITDLTSVGFNSLLEWIYCNEILNFKDELAIELLKVTNRYLLPKLKTEAETYLMKNLIAENLLERAKLAVEFNARDLETAVVNFIFREMNDVRRKEELKNFPNSIQERVCNMEKISDYSFVSKLPKIKM